MLSYCLLYIVTILHVLKAVGSTQLERPAPAVRGRRADGTGRLQNDQRSDMIRQATREQIVARLGRPERRQPATSPLPVPVLDFSCGPIAVGSLFVLQVSSGPTILIGRYFVRNNPTDDFDFLTATSDTLTTAATLRFRSDCSVETTMVNVRPATAVPGIGDSQVNFLNPARIQGDLPLNCQVGTTFRFTCPQLNGSPETRILAANSNGYALVLSTGNIFNVPIEVTATPVV